MEPEPTPAQVLDYQPDADSWRPVVRLCAWAATVYGSIWIILAASLAFVFPDAFFDIEDTIRNYGGGVIGAGLSIGGIVSLRHHPAGRRILIVACSVALVYFIVEMSWTAIRTVRDWDEMRGHFGETYGVLAYAVFASMGTGMFLVLPGLLLLILRRPEARRAC